MSRKKIISLISCFAGSTLVVLALYANTKWNLNSKHGFIRKLPSHKIVGEGFIKLDGRAVYFAGKDAEKIYLGSRIKLNKLLAVTPNNRDTTSKIIIGFDSMRLYKGLYLRTSDSHIYLFDGIKPIILSGDIHAAKFTAEIHSPYFSAALPLTYPQVILRITDRRRGNSLIKLADGKVSDPLFFEQRGDGIFSTDGMLLSTPGAARILYVFYYRNQFLALDTALQVVYKGKTIDTITYAHIKVDSITSTNQRTLSAPPLYVNKHADANNKWLFIHSALPADNEVKSQFKRASVIDVYSVIDGKYAFSFHLPDFEGEKLRDFRIHKDKLIALYEHYLYFFQLNF